MPYTESEKQQLVNIARQSIEHGLRTGKPLEINIETLPAALKDKRATFVTLRKNGELRGCIGGLQAEHPLAIDTAKHAYAAAFQDTRFSPLTSNEIDQLEMSISILSPSQVIKFTDEEDLLKQIQPDIDGLIIEERFHRGVFLPSVWEQLPDKQQFFAHLKKKAGLPQDYWSDHLKVSRFETESISG